jgi:phosphatidylglycerol:prolipoprotein diacylglycerol transferase
MYPDFQYLLHGIFGVEMPQWLSIFKTFGFLVALSFLAAAWTTARELKRKEQEGLLHPEIVDVEKDGKVTRKITYPHQRISDIAIFAGIGGIAGAKIFNAFETWDDFIQHPIENLISNSGLTFLGGLIVATLTLYFYARRHKITFKHLCDAAAPGIILAYGIGRIGCQLSGDGDWGIFNTAYISTPDGALVAATPADSAYALHMITGTPHAFVPAPSWLPDWLFGMNYPHNVGHEGMNIRGCVGEYCSVLPVGVFPTPIYEAIVCIGIFFILWSLRMKLKRPLQMFGAYLVFAGVERFLVELIRVNYKYDWGFIRPSQAEILSVVLVLAGLWFLIFHRDKSKTPDDDPAAPVATG